MLELKNDKTVFAFCGDNEPVIKVASGETLAIDTLDCFGNQLRTPEDKWDGVDWDSTNPATGPIYVRGAAPGDTLKVTIEDIDLDEKGTTAAGEDLGTLGHRLKGVHTKIIKIENGEAVFADDMRIPVRPMIGVIGVAPKDRASVNTGTPGSHGGNMDNTMVTAGATLYFPVAEEGALFGLGDVHAVMGDGEIGVTGLEIPAKVTVTLEVLKGRAYKEPALENSDIISFVASRKTLDEAAEAATENMFDFLRTKMDMSEADLVMLMSLTGNAEVCQMVDPLKTVRFVMPKKYIKGIDL